MDRAIKLNPNFRTAFGDRGTAHSDRHDYDETAVAAEPGARTKPSYAMNSSYHASYANRRDGDRIIQDPNPPIRNNQYNAFAYSPETFPPASPPMIAPEPPKLAAVAPPPPPPAATPPARAVAPRPKTVNVPMPLARPQIEPRPRLQPAMRPAARPRPQPATRLWPRPPERRPERQERFSTRWWRP